MKKAVRSLRLSSTIYCSAHHKQKKYKFAWQLALYLFLTLLPQITSAQTIPNNNSPGWLWAKQAGGPGADQATGVTTDVSGNVYTVGTFSGTATFGDETLTSAGSADIFISKHDASGNLIWVKRAGGTSAAHVSKIIVDATSNIYLAGNFSGSAAFGNNNLVSKGASDIFITKYNPAGEVIWAKAEGNTGNNQVSDFSVSAAGQVYVGGSFNSSITIGNHTFIADTITVHGDNFVGTSKFIAKYANTGNLLWAVDAGGEGGYDIDITFDAAGNSYATGVFRNTVFFGDTKFTEKSEYGEGDNFVIKYNTNGQITWVKQKIGLHADISGGIIKVDPAGNVYIAQFAGTPQGGSSMSLVKYDATGNYHWTEGDSYVWEASGNIIDLALDSAGNVYVAYNINFHHRYISGEDVFFKKYDPSGNELLYKSISSSSDPNLEPDEQDKFVRANNLMTDAAGRIYLSFYLLGTVDIGDGKLLISEGTANNFTAIYDVDGSLTWVQMLAVNSITENGNNTYLAGSFKGIATFGDTTLTSKGDTDAFLVKAKLPPPPPLPPVIRKQAIVSFDIIPKKMLGDAPFPLDAKSNSDLPVTFSIVSGPATIQGNVLTITGVGIITVKASQPGNADYLPALDVSKSFVVLPKGVPVQQSDKTFGGSYQETLSVVVATPNGGYLLGGYSKSGKSADKSEANREPGETFYSSTNDYWIVKVDDKNNKIWNKTFGGSGEDQLKAIVATPDGGYLLGGTSSSGITGDKSAASKGGSDYWIVKIDANGNKIWDKTLGGNNVDVLSAMVPISGGSYLLGGYSSSGRSGDKSERSKGNFAFPEDYWVIKIDENGNKIWDRTLGGSGYDALNDINPTPDGGFLLGGTSNSPKNFDKSESNKGNSTFDYWLVKIDANGVKQWDKTFGGTQDDHFRNMIATTDGSYLLGGTSSSGISGNKSAAGGGFWIIKINASGAKVWDKAYDGNNSDTFSDLIATPDGYLLGGSSNSGVGGDKSETYRDTDIYGQNDYWIVKIDDSGNKLWDQTFGGWNESDHLQAMTTTTDGSYILAGHSVSESGFEKSEDSRGGWDYWIVKLKAEATPPPPVSTWDKTFGGKSFERLTSVVKTSDGGYLLGGHSLSRNGGDRTQDTQGRYDFWVVKTDAEGAKLWDKRYGGADDDYLNHILATTDGGYLFLAGSSKSGVGGNKTSASRGNQDFWIVKIDASGNKLWDKSYGGSGFEDLMQAVQLSTGEYVLAGVSASPISGEQHHYQRGSRDYWLVKVSATGAKLWDKRYGGSKAEELSSLLLTNDGFVLGGSSLSGKSGDKSSENKGGKDYWLVKVNSQGTLMWEKSYGGSGEDVLAALAATTSGELMLAGYSASGVSGDKSQASRGSSDYWLLQVSSNGEKHWNKTYGGSGQEELSSLIETSDNGWLLGGSSFSNQSGEKSQNSQGSSDYWVIKLDAAGEKQWDQTYGGTGEDRLRYLLQADDQGYLLGGFSFSDANSDKSQPGQGRSDYWLVKIPPTPATQSRMAIQPAAELAPNVTASNFRAYPVPASDRLTVQFTLPQTQPAVVQLYNAQGAKVKTLFQGEAQANKTYQVEWQPGSQDGNGLYFLQLQAKHQKQFLKILRTK